jgi:glycosyltransferase involved in cell wall biosynthesis
VRITFLLTWGHGQGGTERAVYTLANHLVDAHEVTVLSFVKDRPEPFFGLDPRVRLQHLVDLTGPAPAPGPGSGVPAELGPALHALPPVTVEQSAEPAITGLVDAVAQEQLRGLATDVLVTTTPALMAYAHALAPPGVVLVHQEHRTSELRGPSGRPLLPTAPGFDCVVVLTGATRDWFAASLREAAPRLEVISNALSDGPRPRSHGGGPAIVAAARITPEKQLRDLVEAFAGVADDRPDWTLRIFGDGPQLGSLRAYARSLGLADRVLLPGPTASMELEWARASVGVLSSRAEGQGLVIAEAFAAGVPFVSYDSPNGPRELIEDGETGLLVAPRDVPALSRALATLMDDPALRRRMGDAALRTAQRMAAEVVGQTWTELLAELLAVPPAERLRARTSRQATFAAHGAHAVVRPRPPLPGPTARTKTAQRLLRARPDLHLSGGRVRHVLTDQTPDVVRRQNLDLVVDAAESVGVGYFLLPRDGTHRYTVGVALADRAALLGALGERHGEDAVYVWDGRRRLPHVRLAVLAADVPGTPGLHDSDVLWVGRCWTSVDGQLELGADVACQVDFWAEQDGLLVAPDINTLADRLPADAATTGSRRIEGRVYTAPALPEHPLLDEVTFPVDAVLTWVDGSDPEWLRRRAEAWERAGNGTIQDAGTPSRFRSRDELRYSLRSLAMYAPWVRHVFLVTDGQRPRWLRDQTDRLTVVDHREIFADPAVLPVFNSHAIESQLHHIPGLADHYLYLNDDVFLGRPLSAVDFFLANGMAKFFDSAAKVDFGPPRPGDPGMTAAGKNDRALVERTFGRSTYRGYKHTPHPQLRAVLEELESRFPEEFRRTAAARFRSPSDNSVAASLHHSYAFLSGRAVPGALEYRFYNITLAEDVPKLSQLLERRNMDVFCINDHHEGDFPEHLQAEVMRDLLDSYFPVPSEFERD